MPEDVGAGDNESTQGALTRTTIITAIEALRLKGHDLNPYSLAEELGVSHAEIVTSSEIMELLSSERGDSAGVVFAEYDAVLKKMVTLEETIKSLQSQSPVAGSSKNTERQTANQKKELGKLVETLKIENDQLNEKLEILKKENNVLSETVKSLESANQVIAMSIQDAWQQGYHAATLDFHKADALPPTDSTAVNEDVVSPEVSLDEFMEEMELLQRPQEETSGDLSTSGEYDIPEYMKAGFFEELDESEKELIGPGGKQQFSKEELRDLWQYRFGKSSEENIEHKDGEAAKGGAAAASHKFVGGKHPTQEHLSAMPRIVPPEIRRSCKILGLRPEELSRQAVFDAWKHEMAKPGVHPDTGGDTEMAMYLNTAKDILVAFLEAQAPKLGKVFGSGTSRDTKENAKVNPEPKNKK